MSKKRSIDKRWCVPSFDDGPPKRRKAIKKKQEINTIEDLDDSLFDIALDDIEIKDDVEVNDNVDMFCDNEHDNKVEDDNKSLLNLAKLIKSCEPKVLSELALSRQKQNEISNWFASKAKHGKPTILVVSGPSGCGKTLAIKLIAEEFNFSITEWITPIDQEMDENGRFTRQGDKFLDFVLKASRYNNVLTNNSKRLLLVKDLPNIFLKDHKALFSVLEKYSEYGRDPLVFICTESGHSQLMTTLFAQNIREQYAIDIININATTQTAMKNMLTRVSRILNSYGNEFLRVTQSGIDEVLANNIGDIRSALLNLIFCSLRVPNDEKMKSDCGSREETLGLLHGIGKVINPKRTVEGDTWKFTNDPDEIAMFFKTMARTFLYFLHENYMNTMRNIEEVALAADALSVADLLYAEWKDPTLGIVKLSLAIRGVMVANQNPVTGWNPVRKPRNVESEVKRNYEQAEIEWYKSIIDKGKPKKEKETVIADIEGIIEVD